VCVVVVVLVLVVLVVVVVVVTGKKPVLLNRFRKINGFNIPNVYVIMCTTVKSEACAVARCRGIVCQHRVNSLVLGAV